MVQVTLDEAKEHFSDLVDAAKRGETVLIESKDEQGSLMLQLSVVAPPQRRHRTFGSAKGLIKSADDFNEPLEDFREYM
jgi:antitoxin (DNA-binding transcriptional repressor) of toxin-antitoxin stability system